MFSKLELFSWFNGNDHAEALMTICNSKRQR